MLEVEKAAYQDWLNWVLKCHSQDKVFSVQSREEKRSCVWGCIQTSAFLYTHCSATREWDTQNKQLSPISWQFIPWYLLLKKIPFPCRATGEKILDKNIRRCPQLAVGKGRESDEGPRQQCKQRGQTPRRDRPGTGGVSLLPQLLPHTLLAHSHATRASMLAGKAELLSCWAAGFSSKAQILHFRVELCADTLLTFLACR